MGSPRALPDLSQFRWISSQTCDEDRAALLSCREAVCQPGAGYSYLEVGSHLGGSLQPHVIDPRCQRILSIDPRPMEQPDERWNSKYKYENNSTARMLELLGKIPGADLGKIQTFESCSWELADSAIPVPVEFAFIDGEHTNAAVLKDFQAVRRFVAPASILAFHDCFATPSAFFRILKLLRSEGRQDQFLFFPGSAVVVLVQGTSTYRDFLLRDGWTLGLPFPRVQGLLNEIYKYWPAGANRIAGLLRRLGVK